jgi:hypothetical protein
MVIIQWSKHYNQLHNWWYKPKKKQSLSHYQDQLKLPNFARQWTVCFNSYQCKPTQWFLHNHDLALPFNFMKTDKLSEVDKKEWILSRKKTVTKMFTSCLTHKNSASQRSFKSLGNVSYFCFMLYGSKHYDLFQCITKTRKLIRKVQVTFHTNTCIKILCHKLQRHAEESTAQSHES